MGMDLGQNVRMEYQAQMVDAIKNNDAKALDDALATMANAIQKQMLDEAKKSAEFQNDVETLRNRGQHVLTTEERTYYNKVIDADGFAGVDELVPTTVINRAFEDLVQAHPLLQEIEAINATGIVKWVVNRSDIPLAAWGQLCSPITKELQAALEEIEVNKFKLSAFIPVCKAMLDLGPEWLDQYVRTLLLEAAYNTLEQAIIDGNGKEQPIGMNRDLEGAVVGGVYPKKTAVALTDLNPSTLGEKVMAPLTKGGKRAVTQALLIVNPVDYWSRIFGYTTFMNAEGTFVTNVWPIPVKVVQSPWMPAGEMVAGIGRDYFMVFGSSQKLDYSDEYQFLEDTRVYLVKQYANGLPKDNDSFILYDISSLDPATFAAGSFSEPGGTEDNG